MSLAYALENMVGIRDRLGEEVVIDSGLDY